MSKQVFKNEIGIEYTGYFLFIHVYPKSKANESIQNIYDSVIFDAISAVLSTMVVGGIKAHFDSVS